MCFHFVYICLLKILLVLYGDEVFYLEASHLKIMHFLFLILTILFHISVSLPKVHPRYDLDVDASMAKVRI